MDQEAEPVEPPTTPEPSPPPGPLPSVPAPRVPRAGADAAHVGHRFATVICAVAVILFVAVPVLACIQAWATLVQGVFARGAVSIRDGPFGASLVAACPLTIALVIAAHLRNLSQARCLGRVERAVMRVVVALPFAVFILTLIYVVVVLSGLAPSAR